MVVATSTDRPMIEAAFERLNLGKYFKKIYTTTEVGSGKDKPDSGRYMQDLMGTGLYHGLYRRCEISDITIVVLSGKPGADKETV